MSKDKDLDAGMEQIHLCVADAVIGHMSIRIVNLARSFSCMRICIKLLLRKIFIAGEKELMQARICYDDVHISWQYCSPQHWMI